MKFINYSLETDGEECVVESICRRTFNIAYIKLQPYVDLREVIHSFYKHPCNPQNQKFDTYKQVKSLENRRFIAIS